MLSVSLGLPIPYLDALSRSASHQYKTYSIAKRSGGFRTIHHPSRRLKTVQYALLKSLLAQLPVHDAATAYKPGASTARNAIPHVKSKYLLRMDFREFFPSLRSSDFDQYVARYPERFPSYSQEDFLLLKRFIFRWDTLTIGAPTSPALSNILCFDLDLQLSALALSRNVTYTRYADDLFFSTKVPNTLVQLEREVTELVEQITLPAGLHINSAKTRHSSTKGRRRVTGVVLGSDGHIHTGRSYKRQICKDVHKFPTLPPVAKRELAGKISYVRSIEPAFLNKLVLKYGVERIEAAKKGE
jgi:RNA-directed DNA polymerase